MDSRQQITSLTEVIRNRFLDQPLKPEEKEQENFDLYNEFLQATKNHSFVVPFFATLFLLILLAVAYTASLIAEQINHQTQSAIGQFEDLKLKELFDTVKKNQRDLETINRQIADIKAQSIDRKKQLQEEAEAQKGIVAVSDSSRENKEKKTNQITEHFEQAIKNENSRTSVQLTPLLIKAAEIQKKIDSYDKRIGALNKENQELLDSQQRVFQLEQQKMVDQYENRIRKMVLNYDQNVKELKNWQKQETAALEVKYKNEINTLILHYTNQIKELILKYNPLIDNPETLSVFHAYSQKNDVFIPGTIAKSLYVDIPPQGYENLQNKITLLQELMDELRAVEYVNSVPLWLHTINQLITDILSSYETYLVRLGERVQQDNEFSALAQRSKTGWLSWVDPVLKVLKTDGIVIDASDSQDIMIILKKNISLPAGQTATLRDPETGKEVAVVELLQNRFYLQAALLSQKDAARNPKNADLVMLDSDPPISE